MYHSRVIILPLTISFRKDYIILFPRRKYLVVENYISSSALETRLLSGQYNKSFRENALNDCIFFLPINRSTFHLPSFTSNKASVLDFENSPNSSNCFTLSGVCGSMASQIIVWCEVVYHAYNIIECKNPMERKKGLI